MAVMDRVTKTAKKAVGAVKAAFTNSDPLGPRRAEHEARRAADRVRATRIGELKKKRDSLVEKLKEATRLVEEGERPARFEAVAHDRLQRAANELHAALAAAERLGHAMESADPDIRSAYLKARRERSAALQRRERLLRDLGERKHSREQVDKADRSRWTPADLEAFEFRRREFLEEVQAIESDLAQANIDVAAAQSALDDAKRLESVR